MRGLSVALLLFIIIDFLGGVRVSASEISIPTKSDVSEIVRKVNDFWISSNPDPGEPTQYTNIKAPKRPDNAWDLSVYFMGNMSAYELTGEQRYLDYSLKWANKYQWKLFNDPNVNTKNADSQTCGVTYIDLFKISPQNANISFVIKNLGASLKDKNNNYWSWIDAVFMAAPLYGEMYKQTGDLKYIEKLHALYYDTKITRQLYDESEGLWYRDSSFFYPVHKTKNNKKIFWSRGNGWIFAATGRIIGYLPLNDPKRLEYIDTFQNMAQALKEQQGDDGFWRASLLDKEEVINPETSGTSLFAYGLALGVNNGWLDKSYMDVSLKAWNGMVNEAINDDGLVGWAQGGGNRPNIAKKNITNDFTTGAFLMAANQIGKFEENSLWSQKSDELKVLINGKIMDFTSNMVLEDNRTLVPIREFSEELGYNVDWNENENKITVEKNNIVIELFINNKIVRVNGIDKEIDVPAKIIDDVTFVPLRFITEAIGAKVDWYEKSSKIIITTTPKPLTHSKEMEYSIGKK